MIFMLYPNHIHGQEEASLSDEEEVDCEVAEGGSNFLANTKDFTIHGPLPNLIQSAVKITFQRYLYGLLNGDIDLILSVTADKIDLPYYSKSINKEMQREFFSELFATYEITKVSADELYCLNTGKMVFFEGERAMITLRSKKNPPEQLKNWHYWDDFWNLQHHYFFEKIHGRWRLIAFDIAYESEFL